MSREITRIYVRRYTNNGDVKAYCEWKGGARTEGGLHHNESHHYRYAAPCFGTHMHALFARAKREFGLRIERETW